MEVHQAPSLELGHLGIGNPHQPVELGAPDPGRICQVATQVHGEATPQLPGVVVPQHVPVVVIGTRVQGLADMGSSAPWRR